jgi:hypothetical protein
MDVPGLAQHKVFHDGVVARCTVVQELVRFQSRNQRCGLCVRLLGVQLFATLRTQCMERAQCIRVPKFGKAYSLDLPCPSTEITLANDHMQIMQHTHSMAFAKPILVHSMSLV